MLYPRFLEYSLQNGLFARGEAVLLAVSGGPDSICMTDLFLRATGELHLRLGVAHVHHHLRSEADEEEDFVRRRAGVWKLPFHALSVHPGAKDSPEAEARRARMEALENLARLKHFSKVALGHNRDDQAETVLMRLLKGSALRGLAGIKPLREGFWIHPLLPFSREEILEYLRLRHLDWKEDASNRDPAFLRNRLRHLVLPLIRKEVNPAADEAIVRTAGNLLLDEDLLTEKARAARTEVLQREFPFLTLSRPAFQGLHPALRHRLAAALFQELGFRWEARHVERLLEYAGKPFNGRIQAFNKGLTCVLTCDTICLCPHGPLRQKVDFCLPGEVEIPGGGFRFSAYWRKGPPGERETSLGPHPPETAIIRPAASLGREALKILKRLGIPAGLKPFLPVLEREGEILWIPGYFTPPGPGHDPAAANMIVRWNHDDREDP